MMFLSLINRLAIIQLLAILVNASYTNEEVEQNLRYMIARRRLPENGTCRSRTNSTASNNSLSSENGWRTPGRRSRRIAITSPLDLEPGVLSKVKAEDLISRACKEKSLQESKTFLDDKIDFSLEESSDRITMGYLIKYQFENDTENAKQATSGKKSVEERLLIASRASQDDRMTRLIKVYLLAKCGQEEGILDKSCLKKTLEEIISKCRGKTFDQEYINERVAEIPLGTRIKFSPCGDEENTKVGFVTKGYSSIKILCVLGADVQTYNFNPCIERPKGNDTETVYQTDVKEIVYPASHLQKMIKDNIITGQQDALADFQSKMNDMRKKAFEVSDKQYVNTLKDGLHEYFLNTSKDNEVRKLFIYLGKLVRTWNSDDIFTLSEDTVVQRYVARDLVLSTIVSGINCRVNKMDGKNLLCFTKSYNPADGSSDTKTINNTLKNISKPFQTVCNRDIHADDFMGTSSSKFNSLLKSVDEKTLVPWLKVIQTKMEEGLAKYLDPDYEPYLVPDYEPSQPNSILLLNPLNCEASVRDEPYTGQMGELSSVEEYILATNAKTSPRAMANEMAGAPVTPAPSTKPRSYKRYDETEYKKDKQANVWICD